MPPPSAWLSGVEAAAAAAGSAPNNSSAKNQNPRQRLASRPTQDGDGGGDGDEEPQLPDFVWDPADIIGAYAGLFTVSAIPPPSYVAWLPGDLCSAAFQIIHTHVQIYIQHQRTVLTNGVWRHYAAVLAVGATPWLAEQRYGYIPYFLSLAFASVYVGAHRGLVREDRENFTLEQSAAVPIAASVSLLVGIHTGCTAVESSLPVACKRALANQPLHLQLQRVRGDVDFIHPSHGEGVVYRYSDILVTEFCFQMGQLVCTATSWAST
jgi:hypothetical protein